MDSKNEEYALRKFEAWGISVRHIGVVYSASWGCDECEFNLKNYMFPDWKKFIVGFSTEVPPNPMRSEENHKRDGYIGGIVVECPRCSKRFWFHVTLEAMRLVFLE